MANKQGLLTVEDVRGWLRVTEAERAQEAAVTRGFIVDRVLTDFVARAAWGLSVQSAADEVWRMRGKDAPEHVRQIVTETLAGIGWAPPTRGGKQ